MAFSLEGFRRFFMKYFKKEQHEEEQISKIEAYIGILYKLLIWEDAILSGFALIFAHILLWVIIHFQLRLYGIFFITLLIIFLFDISFENFISKTDHVIPLKSIREMIQITKQILHRMTVLRNEHPGTFCMFMCVGFILLSIIGRAVSGLVLTYLGLLITFLTPGVIKILPPEFLAHLKHTLHIISTDEGVLDESELLPNAPEDETLEDKDDCESSKTDHTAESAANSFISGVTSMPSYLEAEGSVDGLEEEELDLPRNVRGITPSNVSTDSSDNEHKDIKFESGHFNRDSSSDDDNYEQGLTFSELDVVDRPKTATVTVHQAGIDILGNLGAMGSSIVSTVLKATSSVTNPPAPKKTDSDSDFEIVNPDDDFQPSET